MTTNAKRFLIFAMVLLVTLPALAAPAADPLSSNSNLDSADSSCRERGSWIRLPRAGAMAKRLRM